MKTEFDFTLPRGYLDAEGRLHRTGAMRLATARDEVEPLLDPRAVASAGYLAITLLSRVVTRLGTVAAMTPAVIEGLFASDFAYLQDMYLRLNEHDSTVQTQCPSCGERFAIDIAADAGH